jgi:hypothetical protein
VLAKVVRFRGGLVVTVPSTGGSAVRGEAVPGSFFAADGIRSVFG